MWVPQPLPHPWWSCSLRRVDRRSGRPEWRKSLRRIGRWRCRWRWHRFRPGRWSSGTLGSGNPSPTRRRSLPLRCPDTSGSGSGRIRRKRVRSVRLRCPRTGKRRAPATRRRMLVCRLCRCRTRATPGTRTRSRGLERASRPSGWQIARRTKGTPGLSCRA